MNYRYFPNERYLEKDNKINDSVLNWLSNRTRLLLKKTMRNVRKIITNGTSKDSFQFCTPFISIKCIFLERLFIHCVSFYQTTCRDNNIYLFINLSYYQSCLVYQSIDLSVFIYLPCYYPWF